MIVRMAALLFAASLSFALQARPPKVVLDPPKIVTVDGEDVAYELGTLFVPENRKVAESRTIAVGFARLKARRASSAPPVFWLPGGPGLSVLGAFANDEASRGKLRLWSSFRDVGDVVIVEQRGWTTRGEMLTHPIPAVPLHEPETVLAEAKRTIALAHAAADANRDKDLSGYTLVELAADVDDLRAALGYERISLVGGSFGSQWSLAIMRLHPRSVARAMLSSLEPLDGYDIPSQIVAALQRIAYDADRDPGLAPYLPAGGVMAAIREILDRLAVKPVEVNAPVRVVLGREDFQQSLLTHVQDGNDWPAFVLSIYHGHYDEWARDVIERREAGRQTLIRPLLDTSLGVSAARLHRLRTDPATSVIGTWAFDIDVASAGAWPTPDVGDELRTAVVSAIPVVFVHGDWDVSTPIDNALSLLPYFPNGHVIQVHRGGHDGAFYQLRQHPEVRAALYEFLRSGAMRELPADVALPLPTFTKPRHAVRSREKPASAF